MWKCSECGTEFEGNCCSKCGSSRVENDTLQSHAEEVFSEMSSTESAPAEPPRYVIVAIVVVAIIALLGAVISLAVSLIFSDVRGDREDSGSETEANIEIVISEGESPFDFEVWDSTEIVQIESDGTVLDVLVPPITVVEEETGGYNAFFAGEDAFGDWIMIQISLRDMMGRNFEENFYAESVLLLRWHNEWSEVLDKQEHQEQGIGLMITHWENEGYEGFTFTKIRMYQEVLLRVEIRFGLAENREEFFEAYGFMDSFGDIISSFLDDIIEGHVEQVGFDSPEEAVISFLEGLRVLDYPQMIGAMSDYLPAVREATDAVARFVARLNYTIEAHQTSEFQIPVELYEFQSLEILGFVPPEALTEQYTLGAEIRIMGHRAEMWGVDRVEGRVAIFELGGEKLMLIVEVSEVDGKWSIFDFGGTLDILLLGELGLTQGVISLEFAKFQFLDDGFDLEAVMIPVD